MTSYGTQLIRSTAKHLMGDCAQPGCGRHGLCLPAMDWARGHERMTRDEAVPESMDRVGFNLHTESYQVFLPVRGSVESAAKSLRRIHRKPWRLLCVRCLALKYVRQKFTRWTGDIFGGIASAALRGLRKHRRPEAAIERLVPILEEDIVERLDGMRPGGRRKRVKWSACAPSG